MSLLPATAYRLNWKFTISTCAVPARPCEVGKVSSHIWRHSLATYLLNDQRRNLREVQEILGHVRLETTARYTHIQTHARRDILSSICLPTIPELSRATVQTLFVSARAWDVSALLRELKESTGRWQKVKLENFIRVRQGVGAGTHHPELVRFRPAWEYLSSLVVIDRDVAI